MSGNRRTMLMASLIADSLALGAHWIYNTDDIDERLGRVDKLLPPLPDSYHTTKTRGELTHYGDQTLILTDALVAAGGFDPDRFAHLWQRSFVRYEGYRDHATTDTLANLEAGDPPTKAGSQSSDLGGAARVAPLVYLFSNQPDLLTKAARTQTAMTHNQSQVVAAAALLALTAAKTLAGQRPSVALLAAAREGVWPDQLLDWIEAGRLSETSATRAAIKAFGQMCSIEAAFPAVVHLITKYEDDLESALIENVMAGGDSAARGMLTGMILGARFEPGTIPARWLSDFKYRSRVEQLCDHLDVLLGR